MTDTLVGKKALITGATGGMGRVNALAFAREGISCALMGRNTEELSKIAADCAELGSPATAIVCDIGRTDTLENAVIKAIEALGGLNIFLNCAGINKDGKAHEVDLEAWNTMLDVNLKAHYSLVRYALPEINKNPGGAVIKIGSISTSYSGAGLHLAVHRGLDGYTEALFEDVREYGTKVCVIRAGFVKTPMVRLDRLLPELMIQPEDIARTVLFVLTMPENVCPTEIVIRPQRSPYKKE